MPPAACSRLNSRDLAKIGVFAKSVTSSMLSTSAIDVGYHLWDMMWDISVGYHLLLAFF